MPKGVPLSAEHKRKIGEAHRTSPRARAAYDMMSVLRRGRNLFPASAPQRAHVARWMRLHGLEPRHCPRLFEAYVRLRSGGHA